VKKAKSIFCLILSVLLTVSAVLPATTVSGENFPAAGADAETAFIDEALLNYKSIPVEIEAPEDKESEGGLRKLAGLGSKLPDKYSSVEEGRVSPVKNQGSYGTCWAQTATTLAESSYYLILPIPKSGLSPLFLGICGQEIDSSGVGFC